MTTVTLIDGRVMHSPCWQHTTEQQMLADHCAAMWRMDTIGRREYLAAVERKEGQAFRDALGAKFLAEWEEKKGGGAK